MRPRLLVPTLSAALLFGPVALTAQAPGAVRFCIAPDNPPMSTADPPGGVDVEVARALASHLGAAAHFVWLGAAEEEAPTSVVDALREGRCDAALGAIVPHEPRPASGTLPQGITLSRPYHEIGYVLVRRAEAAPARTLEEVGAARVGVEREGLANLLLRQRGRSIYTLEDAATILAEIARGEIDYGYLWGPVAAWELRGRSDVVVAPEFRPVDRWGVALAVRDDDLGVLGRLDAAIGRLRQVGAISRIFTTHGIPHAGAGAAPSARNGSAPVERP